MVKDKNVCQAVPYADGRMRCELCDSSWDQMDPSQCHRIFAPPPAVPTLLELAAATFRERNAVYGSNYLRQGALLLALFPDGGIPAITTEAEANRLHVLVACVTKLQRYAHSWERGGHKDSAHDLQVYAAMLEEFTS